MALVDFDKADGILEQVTEKYLSVYPDLKVNVHHLQYCRRGEVMKCIILAAGYATRLYPLTENFPKPLLKIGEKASLTGWWMISVP